MSNIQGNDAPDIEIEGLGNIGVAEQKFGNNQPKSEVIRDRNLQEEYNSINQLQVNSKPLNSTPSPNKDLAALARSGVLGKIRQSFKLNVTSKNTESRSSSDASGKSRSNSGRRKSGRRSIRKNFGPSDLEGNFNLGQSRLSLAGIVGKRVNMDEFNRDSLFSKKSGKSSGRDEQNTSSKFGPIQQPFRIQIPSSAQKGENIMSSAEKGHVPEVDESQRKNVKISTFNVDNFQKNISSQPQMGKGDGDQQILDTGGNQNGPQVKLEDIELEDVPGKNYNDNPQEPDFKVEVGKGKQVAVNQGEEYQEVGHSSSRQSHLVGDEHQQQTAEMRMTFEKKILPSGIDPKWITIFLFVQFFANLFVNIDMGILPAGSTKIKQELNIENTRFGFLGSVVYLGQTIGSAMATGVLQTCNPKWVLGPSLGLNIISLIFFTQTEWYMALVICRMCTGLFQVFFAIYFPVWADVYGNEEQKSIWLTYLLIASPLGVVMGYGMCAAFLETEYGWRMAFYLQAIMLVPSFIGILVTPNQYIDIQDTVRRIKAMKRAETKKDKPESNSDGSPTKTRQTELQKLSKPEDDSPDINQEDAEQMAKQADEIGTKAMQPMSIEESGVEIETDDTSSDDDEFSDLDQTFFFSVKKVLSNSYYLLLCASLTGLYYIITGIQYWITDYWITTLKVPETTVFISFAVISITGPVLGVVVGGNVTTCLGGYNSEKSLNLTAYSAIFCLCCAAPIAFMDNFIIVAVLLWFLLFFGGSILPCMTGIMLNTVDQQYKTTANSLANLSYNLLGYLPAPFVYGAIYDSGEGNNGRMAMGFLMFTPLLSVCTLLSAAYLIKRDDVLNYKAAREQGKRSMNVS